MFESNISIEEFKNSAGAELGPSDWLLIDQERINQFAEATINSYMLTPKKPQHHHLAPPLRTAS